MRTFKMYGIGEDIGEELDIFEIAGEQQEGVRIELTLYREEEVIRLTTRFGSAFRMHIEPEQVPLLRVEANSLLAWAEKRSSVSALGREWVTEETGKETLIEAAREKDVDVLVFSVHDHPRTWRFTLALDGGYVFISAEAKAMEGAAVRRLPPCDKPGAFRVPVGTLRQAVRVVEEDKEKRG